MKKNSYDIIFQYWIKHPTASIYYPNNDYTSTEEYYHYGKILLLNQRKKCNKYNDSCLFPAYFEIECNITNPRKLMDELIQQGYFQLASISDILNTYKVSELKTIAESISCRKNGKKRELIQQIIDSLDEDTIKSLFNPNTYYVLSRKGLEFLNTNADYIDLHYHWDYNISLHDYNVQRNIQQSKLFYEIVLPIISERINKTQIDYRNPSARHDYKILYEILYSMEYYDDAADAFLKYLYLTTCCCYHIDVAPDCFPLSHQNALCHVTILEPSMATNLRNISAYCTSDKIKAAFCNPSFPPSFLCQEEFVNLIYQMMEETFFDIDKYNDIFRSRLVAFDDFAQNIITHQKEPSTQNMTYTGIQKVINAFKNIFKL